MKEYQKPDVEILEFETVDLTCDDTSSDVDITPPTGEIGDYEPFSLSYRE